MYAAEQASGSTSNHCSSARLFCLRIPSRCAIFGRCSSDSHTGYSRHTDVPSRHYSIHQGVTSNVQSRKAIRNQPLPEPSHTGWHPLLSWVCHPLSFEPFPFPCYHANDELSRTASCHFLSSICWAPQTFHGSIRGRWY